MVGALWNLITLTVMLVLTRCLRPPEALASCPAPATQGDAGWHRWRSGEPEWPEKDLLLEVRVESLAETGRARMYVVHGYYEAGHWRTSAGRRMDSDRVVEWRYLEE